MFDEESNSGLEDEEGATIATATMETTTSGASGKNKKPSDEGTRNRRDSGKRRESEVEERPRKTRSPVASGGRNTPTRSTSVATPTSPRPPTSPLQSGASWSGSNLLEQSTPQGSPRSSIDSTRSSLEMSLGQRDFLDGQHSSFEDQLAPLGLSPSTTSRRSQSRRVFTAETGQKERDILYSAAYGETTSPAFSSQSQSDDSEREDNALSAQIALLATRNHQLQQLLQDREQERDRLREQLETQRQDRLPRMPSSLPSKLLDGRFLRDPPPLRETAGTKTEEPPVQNHVPGVGDGSRSPLVVRADESQSQTRDYLHQIETLQRSNTELERSFREVSDEKRRLEAELTHQRETLSKIQEREQDLSKDIETLRNENSYHASAVSKLTTEREGLQLENTTLRDDVTIITEKLNKTEKCYKEVEHENLSLEADLDQLVKDKQQLFEEKQKLQAAVEDALKTKENYRSTIRQLREENMGLQGQLSEPAGERGAAGKAEKSTTRKVFGPLSKEQKTLSEVMSLREERSELKEKLNSAQLEIDALEAHLKAQETQEQSSNQIRDVVSSHLSQFQVELQEVAGGLESTRSAVCSLATQQEAVVKEGFSILAQKCREQLSAAEKDRTQLTSALKLSQTSLSTMEEEYEKLRSENLKLLSKRSNVSAEVSTLRSEVASLHDQKRLLEVQLSQNDSIFQQKDDKVRSLEAKQKTLQDKLVTVERVWKNEFDRLDHEWQARLTESHHIQENLSEEKESLLQEKAEMVEQLDRLQLENEKLEAAKSELHFHATSLEGKMADLASRISQNDGDISVARRSIARLLAEKSCIAARLLLEEETHQSEVSKSRQLHSQLNKATSEKQQLSESLSSSHEDASQLREKLEQISQKATLIEQLTSEVTDLTSRNEQMKAEVESLTEKHVTAMQDLQQLAEMEQSHLLDNQMIKMTLTTDIGLLKTKLKTVEEEKLALEAKVAELTSLAEKGPHQQPVGGASAFQVVSESKQVEVLKKQIAALQQETKQHQKSHVADFQSRISALDAENKRLKEAVRGGSKEAQEASASLRKQMSEISQKAFFLESDKKNLTDKVMMLQAALKVARELKDKAANERVQKMEKENLALQERLRALEETHMKKLMVADHKIVETVKENDKLRQKLLQIHSGVASEQKDGPVSLSHSLQELSKSLRTETAAVHSLRTGLTGSREELQQLELAHQRVMTLQTELQSLLPTQTSLEASPRPLGISRTSSIGSALPPVLTSLPREYVSRLQGRPKSPPYGSHPASLELRDKLMQLRGASASLSESLKQHQRVLAGKEADLSSLHERFAAMEGRLEQVVRREAEIQESVASVQEFELRPEQLQAIAVLRKQVEFLQDQVIDRDMALQDIELQMRKDYESHDKKFAQLKSQVLELREQLSAKDDQIRTRDQYIQHIEERSSDMDEQMFKSRKELERMLQEREQLVAQGLPENIQLSGLNIAELICSQGEEVRQLKKVLNEFSFEVSQLQSQLDSVQREKSVLQSKAIEMEKMHVQMKEAMNADINYLRRLNLQLVEQQMKAEKAVEVLHQVKEAQETFKEQRERMRLEAELDSCKVKLHEQERKVSDLEHQLINQHITIKLMQTEKEHGLMMNQHGQELANQITPRTPYMHRPHSAESARKPKYRISESSNMLRGGVGGRKIIHQEGEFSIPLPAQNSSQGVARVDILNLEELPERPKKQVTLSLGPMVVTDDEASYSAMHGSGEKSAKSHQRVQKLRSRGHRRTASTGSNIVVFPMESTATTSSNQPAPHSHASKPPLKPIPKYPRRPGSAGSTRPDVRQITGIESPEHVAETAQEVTKQMTKLINESAAEDTPAIETPEGKGDSNPKLSLGQRGNRTGQGVPVHVHISQSGQPAKTKHKYSEITRSKQSSKTMDSNETASSEGTSGSSKSSGHSDRANKLSAASIATSSQSLSLTGETPEGESVAPKTLPRLLDKAKDLSRTESMSSTTSSTLSIFGPGCTRNPSFVYDGGGEESSPYSHESLEIGDSIENLQALGKLGYNPYILPIPHKHDTTSSSEEDTVKERESRFGRRKRSLGTAIEGSHETPHHKNDNSNSSCDSDQLQLASGFHGNGKASQPAAPVHRNESISISDIERYPTDQEVEDKAVTLQKCFRRYRYSSTGSVKICYSDSNTSLEDISKQL